MGVSEQVEQLKAALASRYVIGRVLGTGGMATVYAAEDLRHGRQVAIKVLDPELGAALGAERFLREIRVTAALHHPHILPLHDSGEVEGRLYYVMPLVEGESLRERLRNEKQLPIDEAVRIAIAVASALDYAHRHNVVHRDLKPENILLQDGQPVIADFGIALAVSRAGGTRITQTGLSLGTPQYMSPEQATADHAIDGRTDIYSLGAVLYEMLTGDPPYTGSTSQAVIARILTDSPRSIRLSRPSVPIKVEAAVDHALAKLPADRFASGLEFAEALRPPYTSAESFVDPTAGAIVGASSSSRARRNRGPDVIPWAVAAIAIVAAAILGQRRATPGQTIQFQLALDDSARLRSPDGTTVTLSPDGSRVIYAGGPESSGQLFIRDLSALASKPIRGTERGRSPIVSPDGRSVLFTVDGRLKRVDLNGGGAPVTVTDSAGNSSWGDSGILLQRSGSARGGSIYFLPSSGGPGKLIAAPDSAHGNWGLSWPFMLPGEKAALITIARSPNRRGPSPHIGVLRLADGSITDLGISGVSARYLPPGYIIFGVPEGVVYGIAFDAKRLTTSGPAVPLLNDVLVKNGGAVELAVSNNGTMVYRSGRVTGRVLSIDRRGVPTMLLGDPRDYMFPALSPEGKRLAITIGTSTLTSDTWMFNTQTGALTRLTEGGGERPEWTPDGKSVLTMRSDSNTRVVTQPWDGSAAPALYAEAKVPIWEISLPRQHAGFLAARVKAGGPRDIWIAPVDSPRALRPFVATDADEIAPSVSPDGRWLAYLSNESGRYEVYVREMPSGPRVQISTNGAIEPLWSPTGRELFYRADGKVMSATVTWQNGTPSVQRQALFNDVYRSNVNAHRTYSVMPDGNGFVFVQPTDTDAKGVVVLNWVEEVRRQIDAARAK